MSQRTFPSSRTAPPFQDDDPSSPALDGLGGLSVPPHDLDAEAMVLGTGMFQAEAIDVIRPILEPGDFYRPAHSDIWRALLALRDEGAPTDPTAVGAQLAKGGNLSRVGGPSYLHRLFTAAVPVSGADYHAQIVREKAELRRWQATAVRLLQQTGAEGADPERIRAALDSELTSAADRGFGVRGQRLTRFAVDGWSFVQDLGDQVEPIWGSREQAAWADGESLMLVGPPGVGKTTIAHQIVLARLGLLSAVLDMPVAEGERVLYLAMDRPPQIARAFARRVMPADQRHLAERLVFWTGPLPASLDREPNLLAEMAEAHRADTVVIDSLKDVVGKLTDDEAGLSYNNARQRLLRSGTQLLELHHQRKSGGDAKRGERPVLDRVYGSAWFTAGAGSVLFLAGAAGDPIVKLHQLKTVTGDVGPLSVVHDHTRGTSTVEAALDPAAILSAAPQGMTARELACRLTGEVDPDRSDIEKARRRLESLVKAGRATRQDGATGGTGGGQQTRYRSTVRHIAAVS
ncbi:DnaB-like helicase N-terminal domain-containing protein [Kitasatospora aureofaciens]|uniref:DnaB-like helicase N-terminal domain-containing protein n=1 Tax=Kitasatospora aureofaciens TaxID=1894 RepID=UPI00383096BB